MIALTVRRGLSDDIGSWKIIWNRRRIGRNASSCKCEMSVPSKMTCPPEGSRSRISVRPSVDLPEPDPPTMPTTSPFGISKLRPLSISMRGRGPNSGLLVHVGQ